MRHNAMYHKIDQGMPATVCDEIAVLAQQYLMEPGSRGIMRIDRLIEEAMCDARWDDMSKWHRVRFRVIRLQQRRALGQDIGFGC